MITEVQRALEAVGVHRRVAMEVTAVELDLDAITVRLVLRLQTATPVCCDEPGCYVRFLGGGRSEVPAAIARALDCLQRPVVIVVALVHEPGYQHVSPAGGPPVPAGPDAELVYDEW